MLIIRIRKSWSAPHMVTFKGAARFYSRNSTGKYPLDVSEIRTAFSVSETLPDRLKNFRQHRLSLIASMRHPYGYQHRRRLYCISFPSAHLTRPCELMSFRMNKNSGWLSCQ